MRFLTIAFLFFALCGCNEPLMKDLDNICEVVYEDGSKESIVCSWAEQDTPAFRSVKSGQIVVTFHNRTKRIIPMASVKSWCFRYGGKDHFGRYVQIDGKWYRKKGGKK
jgi:hypothetical protein